MNPRYKYILCAFMLFLSVQSYAQNWQKGERLSYKITFGIFTIGQAELLYAQDKKTYKIIGRAWDTAPFFTIRDRWYAKGTHQVQPFLTEQYIQNQIENDYRAHKKMVYHRQKKEAISQNIYANLPEKRRDLPKNARDYLSALYAMRYLLKKPQVGDELVYSVMGFSKASLLKTKIVAREEVKTVLGKKMVFKLKPTVYKQNSAKKPKNKWEIWVTDDAQRLPVKIIAKFKFGGALTATLQSVGTAQSISHVPQELPEEGNLSRPKKLKKQAPSYANPVTD